MARNEREIGATSGADLQSGTLLRGAIAAVVLCGVLGGVAWMMFDTRRDAPLDAYRRQGAIAGPIALQRDLNSEFPPGTAAAPVVRRLETLGFACLMMETSWHCTQAAPDQGRRIWRAAVTISLDQEVTKAIEVRFSAESR